MTNISPPTKVISDEVFTEITDLNSEPEKEGSEQGKAFTNQEQKSAN